MNMYYLKIYRLLPVLLISLVLCGCRGAKLSVADEQMARGEYFDASKTYRKIYNKLTKREERPLRGEVAFKMGECYRQLGMSARASAAYQNALRYGYPDSTAYLHMAQTMHEEGRYAQAIAAYGDYLDLDPD
ncbi:MAG: tetratricopeptide repeat protein, partial [Muribaculaceae bacterium]|nr:tetratricopeptide repeat protein [Muribaculaceae bacterium]